MKVIDLIKNCDGFIRIFGAHDQKIYVGTKSEIIVNYPEILELEIDRIDIDVRREEK